MSQQELHDTLNKILDLLTSLQVSQERTSLSKTSAILHPCELQASDTTIRLTPTDQDGTVHLFRRSSSRTVDGKATWKLNAMQGKAQYKTFGIMFLGNGRDPLCAKSGWSFTDGNEGPLPLIDCRHYTQRVIDLCGALDFHLEAHEWDHGLDGRYHASFAEMKLITWLVEMVNPSLFNETGADETKNGLENDRSKHTHSTLEEKDINEVLIITNLPIATDLYNHCERFAALIGKLTGISIALKCCRESIE